MAKQSKTNSILYVKLSSLGDLCRHACNFDHTASSIVSVKSKSGYLLMTFGEHLNGSTIAYYIEIKESESIVSYTYPSSINQGENAHFVKEMGTYPNYSINILSLDGKNLKKAAKIKPIPIVNVKDPDALITAVIRRGVAHETLAHIYSFSKGDKTIYCAFDIIEELGEGPRTLYYSIASKKSETGFARYKYTDNKIDFATYMGEPSYMYAKIINLAEPFPFFKMPN